MASYKLFRNDGADGTALTEISSFDFGQQGFIATINTATESITAGLFYQFSYKAVNSIGSSV